MVTITFQTEPNNADLLRLLDLARRFKLPFQIAEKSKKTKNEAPLNNVPTKSEFLADFKESLLWAKQHDAGKVEHQQSFDDFLNALENDIEAEKAFA